MPIPLSPETYTSGLQAASFSHALVTLAQKILLAKDQKPCMPKSLRHDHSQAAFSLCIDPADIYSGLQRQAMTYSERLCCQPTMVPDEQGFFSARTD